MFEGFESGRMSVEGTEIAYVRGGSGPPILLLHGFPQTKEMWARVAPRLAERHTVVCVDLRGYGASDKPRSDPDSANYAFAMAADWRAGSAECRTTIGRVSPWTYLDLLI